MTKTIFNKTLREELIKRINGLNAGNQPQWGKMNLCGMLKHCTVWEAWIQGKIGAKYKQELIGRVFGKIALRRMIGNDKPFGKNVPTSGQFKIAASDCDVEAEKHKWIDLIRSYEHFSNPGFIHDFFGKMTVEQIGILAYKHTDHHLRQFNA